MIRKKLFGVIRSILPTISATEIIALRSGGVSVDREIFLGKVTSHRTLKPVVDYSNQEMGLYHKVDDVLDYVGSEEVYPNSRVEEILKKIGQDGFFGMIIDSKYGGHRTSITMQSRILTKMASFNPSVAVVVMVPNSLGPAELLEKYGTEGQKKQFLPALASGRYIPCFGLTGPHNGSDATGSIDHGVLRKDESGKRTISVNLNKRYITLAPVSNLVGIAFYLKDPDRLLQEGTEGITVALVPHPAGILQRSYHDPNGAGFPNGTLKGTIEIDPSQIIGGEKRAGSGWTMLMECLAVGRGVSLPASANGSAKAVTLTVMHYIQHRRQFKRPIGTMQAIQEKFVDMFFHTWVLQASVLFTNTILDHGATPSVLTALMKQQTTERARIILQHGMDIYAGSGICRGNNNVFSKFYQSSPIGITVEGSNTLTRGLLIFGQGINKSHPFIFEIFDSIQSNNVSRFEKHLMDMLCFVATNYTKSMVGWIRSNRLELLTLRFSTLSNFIALYGGKIKAEQVMSGQMADIFSNIYLGYSVLWFHSQHTSLPTEIQQYCIDRLCWEAEQKMNHVMDNYRLRALTPLLFPLKYYVTKPPSTQAILSVYATVQTNTAVHAELQKDVFLKGTVTEKLMRLSLLSPEQKEYQELYEEIIQVGEYDIKNILSTIK